MLQLQIRYCLGIIGIEKTPAQVHIRCQPADMEIRQEIGQLEMRREPPEVQIDLKEAFGDLGMRKPDQVSWELRAKAWQTFRFGLDRVVSEGDRLSRIELGGQPVVELARENFAEHKELNVRALPARGPEIQPVGGGFAFQYNLGGVEIKVEPKTPEVTYYPGSIQIYWLQEPWLEMEVVGSNVDLWV
mgnify:FL=1